MNYILNEKLKNKDILLYAKETEYNDTVLTIKNSGKVYFPPSVNEWHNSIYTFKKRTLFSFLYKDSAVYTLLDSYFNLKPKLIRKNFFKKFSSLKRIFISKPEIKHSSNKVVITVYTLNKEKKFFLYKLNNLKDLLLRKIKPRKIEYKRYYFEKNLRKKLRRWYVVNKYIENGIIYHYIKGLKKTKIINYFYTIVKKTRSLINKDLYLLKEKKNLFVLNIVRNILKYKLKKTYLYKRYTGLLYLNSFKFNINLMLGIKNILYKIYNKKIELNIVNIKYLYLENSFFANVVVKKLNNRKNRIRKIIKRAIRSVKLPHLDFYLKMEAKKEQIIEKRDKEIMINYNNLYIEPYYNILGTVLKKLRNKHLIGVKLEGKGRLTRRLTASRSVYKSRSKGGLNNIFSSFQTLSTAMLKGFANSNVQYTNVNSKSRNGSFGLKSWIGSY
jgi:Mitochondrial ribosomal protein (VAR1)